MKTKLSTLMAMVLLLLFANVNTEATKAHPEPLVGLLETGEFHGEEVSARTGEKWLGLHVTDQHSTLLKYQLTVESVHDPITDHGANEKTGKKVSVDLPLEPLFLVKSGKILRGGPVTTVFKQAADYEKSLERVSPHNLKLAETTYVLKVVGSEDGAKCSEHSFPKNAKLVLVSGDVEQVLYSIDGCGNEPYWYLLWAGDLDRDGKLDLYVSVTQHYNVSERKLFLSSRAKRRQLVAEVAEFVTSGC
ncbi:MAG: hypothetical protein ACREBC_16665 [Pyrinomonadaceae bacterium]